MLVYSACLQITPETLVGDLVEEVATNKALPPDHYALYLVIGEFDSYRVLSSTDRLLGALSSVGSECYLCLKPNAFYASIRPFVSAHCDPCVCSLYFVSVHCDCVCTLYYLSHPRYM